MALVAACAGGAAITGTYSGYYQCAVQRTLELQVTELGGGRLSAIFIFGGGTSGSYRMTGFYDGRSGRVHLEPQQWIVRPPGFNMIGLDGVFDLRTRRLTGMIPTFGCGTFELGPPGMVSAPRGVPARPANPAYDPNALPVNPNQPDAAFEYWDAAMNDPPGTVRESEPIDDVIDWLRKLNFSCMGTRRVIWDPRGTRGSAADQVSVRERFVIECNGDCRGVRYTPYADASIYHFRKTQPAPVLELRTVWLGGTRFRWEFRRNPNGQPPPDIYVHRWTSSGFNSGGDCRAPKSNSR